MWILIYIDVFLSAFFLLLLKMNIMANFYTQRIHSRKLYMCNSIYSDTNDIQRTRKNCCSLDHFREKILNMGENNWLIASEMAGKGGTFLIHSSKIVCLLGQSNQKKIKLQTRLSVDDFYRMSRENQLHLHIPNNWSVIDIYFEW